MCRGLALGIDKKMNIICKGFSGHTDTGIDNGEHLKLELIIDDSSEDNYVLELDDTNDTEEFSMFLTKTGKLKKVAYEHIMKWIKDNEIQILKWLLVNRTYARSKKNQDMSYCKAGENQDMRYCKAGENQYMHFCEAGKNQYMSFCKAKKRIISYMKSANEENNSFIKMLSDNAKNNELDWDYLVELARKGYKVI